MENITSGKPQRLTPEQERRVLARRVARTASADLAQVLDDLTNKWSSANAAGKQELLRAGVLIALRCIQYLMK